MGGVGTAVLWTYHRHETQEIQREDRRLSPTTAARTARPRPASPQSLASHRPPHGSGSGARVADAACGWPSWQALQPAQRRQGYWPPGAPVVHRRWRWTLAMRAIAGGRAARRSRRRALVRLEALGLTLAARLVRLPGAWRTEQASKAYELCRTQHDHSPGRRGPGGLRYARRQDGSEANLEE